MKITPVEPQRPTVFDRQFVLELTGEELVRLWHLSYTCEGGDSHSRAEDCRFWHHACGALGLKSDTLSALFDKFRDGRYVG